MGIHFGHPHKKNWPPYVRPQVDRGLPANFGPDRSSGMAVYKREASNQASKQADRTTNIYKIRSPPSILYPIVYRVYQSFIDTYSY